MAKAVETKGPVGIEAEPPPAPPDLTQVLALQQQTVNLLSGIASVLVTTQQQQQSMAEALARVEEGQRVLAQALVGLTQIAANLAQQRRL